MTHELVRRMRPLARSLSTANRSVVWRRPIQVGPDRLLAPSFDRLLYLWWHRLTYHRNAELNFLRSCVRPGAHVVDVGANVGLIGHALARAVGPAGRVSAFEPDPLLFEALETSARTNGLRQLQPHCVAVGSRAGSARLRRGTFNSGDTRVVPGEGAHGTDALTVPVTSLDEFLDGTAVDFVKIDVQGSEVDVLRGMQRTLATNPTLQLYVELWPHGLSRAGTSAEALIGSLVEHGFEYRLRPRERPAWWNRTVPRFGPALWYTNIHAWRTR
jgi:FkbM family methyltransferase